MALSVSNTTCAGATARGSSGSVSRTVTSLRSGWLRSSSVTYASDSTTARVRGSPATVIVGENTTPLGTPPKLRTVRMTGLLGPCARSRSTTATSLGLNSSRPALALRLKYAIPYRPSPFCARALKGDPRVQRRAAPAAVMPVSEAGAGATPAAPR